ncbi:uncharacterized protein FA14DRAFT_160876 [Meira miltonrushii]|uniref:sn-1-specific diacylglycerol lipase n=1 Tax=Meira miltonrushii TaxID=1280837 RepID=A0A316VFR3_9BASI|nr:uncharacterized protein FA14DRAFT_160876 [Meira miltonrushii]PWN35908.1 hypothetical protein FA14DRAFT_160876 [Meira miltonrushii]
MTTLSPGLMPVASPEPIPTDAHGQHDSTQSPNTKNNSKRVSIENVTMVKAPQSENLNDTVSDIEDLEPLPPSGIAIPIGPSSTRGQLLEPKGSSSLEGTSLGSLPSLHLESPMNQSSSSPPHTYFDNSNGRRPSKSSSHKRTSLTNTTADSSMPLFQSSYGPYSARYVTVSSILSRSGAAIPLSPPEEDLSHYRSRRQSDSSESQYSRKMPNRRKSSRGANTPFRAGPRSSTGSAKSSTAGAYEGKRASNGSALEALGALFLQRDSIGKVSNLSFMKYSDALSSTKQGEKKSLSNRITFGLSSVSRAWMERMSGSSKIGIRMPHERDAGQTIAQRRARKSMATDLTNGARIEGTRGDQPSFEVLISSPAYPVDLIDELDKGFVAKSPPPAPRLLGMKGDELTPPPIGEEEEEDSFDQARTFLRNDGPMTEPIKGVYGPGSAFSWTEPPELPPSPIGMPGAWAMGSYGWNKEEGALLLPPPLLDDQGSDAKSFEGLLGVRRMREQERARKQFEKLKARNRPAHKVGMLTAFSNFVKAAHAADKATRSAGNARARAPILQRRHTEPAEAQPVDEEDVIRSPVRATTSNKPQSTLDAFGRGTSMGRTASQSRSSLDSSGRQLNTVFEARSPDVVEDEDDIESSDDEDDIAYNEGLDSTPSLRRRATTTYLDRNQQVPIRMSESEDDQAVRAHSIDEGTLSNYLDAEHRGMNGIPNGSAGPATPRIGPTMLSLPPSPWTPYGGATRSGHQTPFHVHLGMTPVLGPPGTPRLIPAMLEVAPSPFPTLSGMTPFLRSPVRGPSNGGYINSRSIGSAVSKASAPSTTAPSPLALSPNESPVLAPFSSFRKRLTTENMKEHDGELTPSATKTSEDKASVKKSVRVEEEEEHSHGRLKTEQNSKRSFLLWFLFGDLGLGSRSSIAAKAAGSPAPFVGKRYSQPYVVVLSIAAHLYGFSVFLLAHLVDLGYRTAEFLSMTFWFLRWMALNLTGQTVLARCAIDAYALVSREWESVAREDHERKGKKGKSKEGIEDDKAIVKYRGLTKWQVLKGLIELVCLQDVTRERYLEEGAGLEELKGWKKKHIKSHSCDDALLPATPSRIDLGIRRAADRKAKDDKEARQAFEEEIRAAKSQESDDDEDSDSESSDDDMVVTNRGAEILEFTKTPKVERHTYFPSSEDGMDDLPPRRPSRYSKRSLSGTSRGSANAVHVEPTNRPLVRMIKWASRLAISAYGLHVTLVDLPATFTPSGNRFSRQTFAHLSRLHHEDVLHADIQTLDSDDYSPTFYLVRDLTRKVVVVSVRGTQSLQDIIVDLEMVVDQFELGDENVGKDDQGEPLYCHAGILRAARALLSHNSTLYKTLDQALREHPDFGIVFTGHSLGGAIASTVVLLLSRYEEKRSGSGSEIFDGIPDWSGNEDDQEGNVHGHGRWVTHDRSGLPAGRPIRAITFAHPATVNATLAERASRGRTPLVLSVVLGHDIIPRCGHGQARELRRVLGALSRVRRRKEHGNESRRGSVASLDLHGEKEDANDIDNSDARVHIVTSWWEWRKLKRRQPSTLSKSERMRMFKIEEDLWRLRCDVESDLYSAVKRRSEEARFEDSDQKSNIPPSPWIGPSHKAPLHQLAERRQALDAVTLANEESISKTAGVLVPAGRSIWIYEGRLYKITSPLSFFSLPDFHARMFSEHFPSAYEDWLERL